MHRKFTSYFKISLPLAQQFVFLNVPQSSIFLYYFCVQENLKTLKQGNSFHINKKLLEKGRQVIVLYSIGPKVMGSICKEEYLS